MRRYGRRGDREHTGAAPQTEMFRIISYCEKFEQAIGAAQRIPGSEIDARLKRIQNKP
jgi:hypothetical protein